MLGFLVTASCGVYDLPSYMPPPASDVVCYDDSDCAPNGCCGEGDAIVHVTMAPSCTGRTCTGSCPRNGIMCGCAVPVCRDGQCRAAVSPTPDC